MAEIKDIKEVTVFCEQGDSSLLSTWSNVPYFLTNTLIKHGIKVNRVNLSPNAYLPHKIFYKLWNAFVKGVLRRKLCPTYRRSSIYFFLSRLKINREVKRYSNSDLFLFTSFSFPDRKISDKPVVIFCDWTAEYDYRIIKGMDTGALPSFDKAFIDRQRLCFQIADYAVTLFPGVAEYLRAAYKNPDIRYIGNVVNSMAEPDSGIIASKERNKEILFIGKRHYKEGAIELIQAFEEVTRYMPDARLNIIGMDESILGELPDGVTCYGYLAKENPEQCKTYYRLLSECRLFINTTPKWAGFSACIEAMYYFTPVIVTPYGEFVKTFGKGIGFGTYHSDGNLAGEIISSLSDIHFRRKALAAHNAVAGMTWDNFVARLLEMVG